MSRTASNEAEPLVVSVNNALRLLAVSRTTLYRRLRMGEIEGFADGGRRKITIASIKRYVAERCHQEVSLREAKKLLREPQAERATAASD
jgi:excisionase family DNA binding protein